MGVSIYVRGFEDKNNPEFKKHLETVKFCLDRGLSYPRETSSFFKGKIAGDDLEDIGDEYILDYIKEGLEVDLLIDDKNEWRQVIKVKDIPKSVDTIIIEMK